MRARSAAVAAASARSRRTGRATSAPAPDRGSAWPWISGSYDHAGAQPGPFQRHAINLQPRVRYVPDLAHRGRQPVPNTVADDREPIAVGHGYLLQVAEAAGGTHRKFQVVLAKDLGVGVGKRLAAMAAIFVVFGHQQHLRRSRQPRDLLHHLLAEAH